MRFLEYINEAKIKNDPKLKKLYDKFNKDLFLNVLGTSLPENVVVGWSTSKRNIGTAKAIKDSDEIIPKNISISKKFNLSEDQLKGILVHEMIHIYFYYLNKNISHKPEFIKIVDTLKKYVDFHIPYKEEEAEMIVDEDKVFPILLMKLKDGRLGVVAFNKKFFKNNLYDIFSYYSRYAKELYTGYSKWKKLNEIPETRKIPKRGGVKFRPLKKEEFDDIKTNMEIIKWAK
ncbi:MAG: SprT-like domain-containing protein [Candidatus Woesearchaeota archaeon]